MPIFAIFIVTFLDLAVDSSIVKPHISYLLLEK